MATVPISGTDIRLLTGVPFSNDYKNSRWFDSETEQLNYFLNKTTVHTISDATFQRIEGRTFVKANKSIDDLWNVNYLMFRNTAYNSKWFYAFVTKLEYKNEKLTFIHFEIDVFQTWKFEMDFKPSFIIRQHCPLWNADGSPVINTLDEGLNYGTKYETVQVDSWEPYHRILFLVIVTKAAMHDDVANKIKPNVNGLPQPLTYYVQPFKMDGTSPASVHVDSNLGMANFDIQPMKTVLEELFTQDDAVNNVVSLYVTDYLGVNVNYDESTDTMDFGSEFEAVSVGSLHVIHVKEVLSYDGISHSFGNKYDGYTMPKESKLLMYPYTVLQLTDYKGNQVDLKNEYIKSQTLTVTVKGSMGTSNKVSYSVDGYLQSSTLDNGRFSEIENALVNNAPNDLPILSDYLSAYLQGNKQQFNKQLDILRWQGITDVVTGGVTMGASMAVGNPIGAGMGVAQVAKGAGNSALQQQLMHAKMNDIRNVPPSISQLGSNAQFEYGNDYKGIYVVKKQITSEYREKLENYFNMYGYKKNEVQIPNFHTRKYWNYVQTSNCVITGNFNNEDLTELKSVFDNGITFWHTDDVGNYSLENEVI